MNRESMFEVLVYMFENYVVDNIQPDHNTLTKELFAAGFDHSEITDAVEWFNTLESMASVDAEHSSASTRIYSEEEKTKFDTESLNFLVFLAHANIINLIQHEIVIERAMALPQTSIHLDEIRWVVLMVLRKQGKTKDFLFVEDAMFHEDQPTLH